MFFFSFFPKKGSSLALGSSCMLGSSTKTECAILMIRLTRMCLDYRRRISTRLRKLQSIWRFSGNTNAMG